MLQVGFIRDNKEEVISRLSKRIDDAEKIVNDILILDISRRDTQTQLDSISSELNIISKEIGILFKSGQSNKASVLKQKTQDLKEQKSVLTELLKSYYKKAK